MARNQQTEDQKLDNADPASRTEESSPANRGNHQERRLVSSTGTIPNTVVAIVFGLVLSLVGFSVGINAGNWAWGALLVVAGVILAVWGGFRLRNSADPHSANEIGR